MGSYSQYLQLSPCCGSSAVQFIWTQLKGRTFGFGTSSRIFGEQNFINLSQVSFYRVYNAKRKVVLSCKDICTLQRER